jgi:hypothetical protein
VIVKGKRPGEMNFKTNKPRQDISQTNQIKARQDNIRHYEDYDYDYDYDYD